MRKSSYCAAILAGAAASPVWAADLYTPSPQSYSPVYAAASAFTWSGFYVGLQGGYGWGDATTNEYTLPGHTLNDGPLNYDADGFFGGVHAGVNFQAGSIVYGAEADIEYADISGSYPWGNGDDLTKTIDWMGSVRGRLGYAFNRLLVYATGGLAYADVEMSATDADGPDISSSEWTAGWTLGGGAEYALTDNVSVRGEYRYSDFGDTELSGNVYGGSFAYPHDNKVQSVRVGISYKF